MNHLTSVKEVVKEYCTASSQKINLTFNQQHLLKDMANYIRRIRERDCGLNVEGDCRKLLAFIRDIEQDR